MQILYQAGKANSLTYFSAPSVITENVLDHCYQESSSIGSLDELARISRLVIDNDWHL
jgi:hypothetical protein